LWPPLTRCETSSVSGEKRAIAELLSAAPSFRPAWRGFLPKTPDATEAVGELVEHLGAGEVRHAELAATLQVAAQLLQRRDEPEAVRLAGDLIEDLQLLASYPDTGLQAGDVEAALPSVCRAEWDALDAKWRTVWASLEDRPAVITLDRYEKALDTRVRRLVRTTCRVMSDGLLVGNWDVLRWEVDNPLK
jgi:hypothetical protein